MSEGCGWGDDYAAFLASKQRVWTGQAVSIGTSFPDDGLFPFQAALTRWALRKGRASIFADTGLGKTRMQLAWASQIPGRVLILAPLAVAAQTIAEGVTIGVAVDRLGEGDAPIEITNYERLHHVNTSRYAGVVLDESSILKAFDGKTRDRLIKAFGDTPYRLCCTATPAPNDIAELANHCEFLGIMTRVEMLATFFVHDEDGWRLKGHAREAFYRWLASWGMFVRRPSDLGFDDAGYILPPLRIHQHVAGDTVASGEYLFADMGLGGIRGRISARRQSLGDRVKATVDLVQRSPGTWIVWCGLNDEQDAIAKVLGDECVSVVGSQDAESKVADLAAFLAGEYRVLVTKPRIAGYGLNLQHCAQMAFLGLGDSYEQYYQAIRRCWRFGQTRPVDVHIVVSPAERDIVMNVQRKERDAALMAEGLLEAVRTLEREEIGVTTRERVADERAVARGTTWTLYQGDCVEVLRESVAESAIDFSVYSPPFQSLYTYTNSERDIGNCATRAEFLAHYGYVVGQILRVTKPGRLTAVHLSQIVLQKARDGVIGLSDLRGAIIALHEAKGWIYHGEVCIDKDPQAQAIRTKSKGLLFVQLRKDASWLRPGLADYILVFRKPGDNSVPILPDITNNDWIEWARPIWYNIREADTLNVREARANDDDRHICPLQLGTIERCVRLWSNPGEVVLSPFAGIGSEGYEAVRLGRRFLGCELKREYWESACRNIRAVASVAQGSLFSDPTPEPEVPA